MHCLFWSFKSKIDKT